MPLPTLAIPGNLAPIEGEDEDKLAEMRPIDYILNWIDKRMPTRSGATLKKLESVNDRILLVVAETGSGKSTFMIAELFHTFFSRVRRNIGITQPRIVTAMEIPADMVQYGTKEFYKKMRTPSREVLKLGKNIGYQTGLFEKRPIVGMVYMTAQVLTQQLLIMSDSDFMNKYAIIVVDEVHERSIASDLTMYLLKKFVSRNYKNPKCPFVILTSATFDALKFAKYFGVGKENIIKVIGATYPIEEHFLTSPTENVISSAIETVKRVHKEYESDFKLPDKAKSAKAWAPTEFRDIIIFVPGMSQIREIGKGINNLNMRDEFFKKYPVLVIELHGGVVKAKSADYKNIFKSHSALKFPIESGIKIPPTRRVIISTSVAETGLTIETLMGVIDSGLQYSAEFNPLFNTGLLIQAPVAQSMARQRRGRAGRKAPGRWFPLYTRDTFDKLLIDQYPEILRGDLSEFILQMIIQEQGFEPGATPEEIFKAGWNVEPIDLTKLDLLDMPMADSIACAVEKLYNVGAIDFNTAPTRLGLLLHRFRKISLESARMILAGYFYGANVIQLITIAAMVNYPREKFMTFRLQKAYKKSISEGKFSLGISWFDMKVADDFIRLLGIFEEFASNIGRADLSDWCENVGINYEAMMDILSTREEIIDSVVSMGLNPYLNYNSELNIGVIKQCIHDGYSHNLAMWDENVKKYIDWRTHRIVNVNSDIVPGYQDIIQYGDYAPRYILYDSIITMLNRDTNLYKSSLGYISVMDGFVSVDLGRL